MVVLEEKEQLYWEKNATKGLKRAERENNFSKFIMSTIVLLYIIGAVLGTLLVIVSAIVDIKNGMPLESSMFIAYAAYLGGPTATSIIFYAWKSKAENVLKIGQSFKAEEDCEKTIEVMEIISKMGDM